MICIHHNDLDGKCAAAIVGKFYFGAKMKFVEMDYAKKINFKYIVLDSEPVIIVDFSFKPDAMDELLRVTKNVVWIDHHATARDYPYQHLDGLRNFQDKAMAGCELTWNYFFPYAQMPRSVQLIGDYDKWALKFQPECFQFYEGMKLVENEPLSFIWNELLDTSYYKKVSEIIESGKTAIQYRDSYCAGLCKAYGYETEIDGNKAYACNQFMFGSGGFVEKFQEYPLCLAYIHDGKKFTVSLYSTKIDVSVIAKNHGGGGHKGAAGFVCESLPF
jgi:oligoribonuclease NrnB/cAMP/cGMP phosphodiesterase (DHH superfamily)